MRELDTTSPVIWPSWCYSGVGETELEIKRGPIRMNGANFGGGGGNVDHLTNNNSASNNNNTSHNNNNNNNNNTTNNNSSSNNNCSNSVKAERLSPPTGDNNSSSPSRSGTPVSSYEGTPPTAPDRASSPHIKVMDQVMTRNYSDFMRSLAAKYNHANPNDYFSTNTGSPGRNGFPGDPRFVGGFKTGAAAPFVGLMAPLSSTPAPPTGGATNSIGTTTGSVSNNSNSGSIKDSTIDSKTSPAEAPTFPPFGHNPFVQPGVPPLFPPMIDMSSTQALLNMVRTASTHSANQLETYLKGAIKRGSENPLDLSASKKSRKSAIHTAAASLSLGESLYGDALLGLPMLNALNRVAASKEHQNRLQSKSPKPIVSNSNSSSSSTTPVKHNLKNNHSNSIINNSSGSINRPQCLSMCSDKTLPCANISLNNNLVNSNNLSISASEQNISSWNIDDVFSFVSSIDICAEYASNFREQRIDGSALPLLTEQHLTTALQMKLGPALKLRAVLSRILGHCAICLHCVHCHGSSATNITSTVAALASTAATLQPSPSPKPTVRPNSAGN